MTFKTPPLAERRLLIVWWSYTGGTESLVHAGAQGACEALKQAASGASSDAGHDAVSSAPGMSVIACRCDLIGTEALLRADALLFATPECLGSMAGPMKTFFERSYYPALDHLNGRPYATLICAGTDGQGAARQIDRIATGWRLKSIAKPLIVLTGAQTAQAIAAPKTIAPAELARAGELGALLAAGTQLGVW
ncbi:MAG: NAD(P)H-dependent oxidoreductase [Burkholderiales bacterium]